MFISKNDTSSNLSINGLNFLVKKDKIKIIKLINKVVMESKLNEYLLDVVFIDNQIIRYINNKFRGINQVTDVLSFSNIDGEQIPGFDNILGEIIISIDQAVKQSKIFKHSLNEEIMALFVHGLCHLLGFNHEESKKKLVIQIEHEITLLSYVNISKKIAICGRC